MVETAWEARKAGRPLKTDEPVYNPTRGNWKEVLDTWVGQSVADLPKGVATALGRYGYDVEHELVGSWTQRPGGPVPRQQPKQYSPTGRRIDPAKERAERYFWLRKLFTTLVRGKPNQEQLAMYLEVTQSIPWEHGGEEVFRPTIEQALKTCERLPAPAVLIKMAESRQSTYTPEGPAPPAWSHAAPRTAPELPPVAPEQVEVAAGPIDRSVTPASELVPDGFEDPTEWGDDYNEENPF